MLNQDVWDYPLKGLNKMARRDLKSIKQDDKNLMPNQESFFDARPADRTNEDSFFRRISKYGWDLLGIFLIGVAFILFLGFLNITEGLLVTPLTNLITRWFGSVGRFFIVAAFLLLGFSAFRWRKEPDKQIPFNQIIAIELSGFVALAILSIIQGRQVANTESGFGLGGMVGWGLAELFRMTVGSTAGLIILLGILLFLLIIAFDLLTLLENVVSAKTNETPLANSFDANPVLQTSKPAEEKLNSQNFEKKTNQGKGNSWLPPEYRKSFDTPDIIDEVPNQALERSKDIPPLELLQKGETYKPDKRSINLTAGLIEKTLAEFSIPARVVGFRSGPTVTQFAVEPGYIDKSDEERQKIRVSQISSLQKDLALALSAERLRIEAPVPGKSYVGIEIPNPNSAVVQLRPLLESEVFSRVNSPLALTLGRDVSGRPVVSDLATMPHLLIAGTTGSGKSVCITAITACLVMNNTPDDLKLAMIDPKRVELMRFNGLPHLMGNVETEIDRILGILRWATTEMDYRYELLEKARSRNIDSYNKKLEHQNKRKLPKIVILIDELADLMITAPDETEHAIIRLAQKSRAVGIHLILATQRPSTDVVTGLIKANFPTRISFAVASSIDSRVILDTGGAETLLGKGDMLFLNPEIGLPLRAQGAMVSDRDLNRIINWWKKSLNLSESNNIINADESPPWEDQVGSNGGSNADDHLVEEAIKLIKNEGKASASFFQRQLRVGYPRAARLVDQLEEMGILGPSQGGGREREILMDTDEYENI